MFNVQPSWALTPEGVLRDPIVTIDDGVILRCSAPTRQPDGPVERLPGRLLLPGIVDAHSHAFQRAFRGHVQWRADGHDDFWSWRQAMYATANRLSPEGVHAVSRLAFLELVEAGVTEVGEFHYLHHQPGGAPYDDPDELALRVVAAAREVGLRITLLWVLYARGGPGLPLAPEQRRFGSRSVEEGFAAVERLRARVGPLARVGLAPHSVRAIPPAWWSDLATFSGVCHAHVAEQPREVEACRAETGRSPLALLDEAGVLRPTFWAVHLTHPDPADLHRLRRSGAGVVVCPSTELDLGDGVLPLGVREGIPRAVGTDSHALADPWRELGALELHARALAGRRNVMSPPGDDPEALAGRLLRIGSSGGAAALGGSDRAIAPGAPADLVALDLRRPAAAGQPPLVAAALSATADWVDRVWVAGAPVVVGGRHPERDRFVADAAPFLGA